MNTRLTPPTCSITCFVALLTVFSAFFLNAGTNYFLVADPQERLPGSYVLPLTNPVQVAYAKRLANRDPTATQRIVVAVISPGFDCLNRDYRSQGTPAWSWHVIRCCNFAEFTIELCDGTPPLVEQDVNRWMDNTGGTICFWNYTVVEELFLSPPSPPPRPGISLATLTNGSVHLTITNLASPYVCSVERAFDLSLFFCGSDWRTVASFPVSGSSTNWDEPLPNGSSQIFYRVRIDCPR